MDCLNLIKNIGIECTKFNDTFVVSSPLSFSDGSPMSLYIKLNGTNVTVSDDGDLLFSLNANGVHTTDGRRFNFLSEHAKDYGIILSSSGSFEVTADAMAINKIVSNFMHFYSFIADWEKKTLSIGNEESSFIDKVITDLRSRFPSANIIEKPDEIYGASGSAYRFNVKMDSRYIDIISAHSNSTGAALRKIADIKKADDAHPMLFIIDDYKNPDKAEMESLIISGYCPTMLATSLAHNDVTVH